MIYVGEMPQSPMAMAAPIGIHIVLSVICDLRHICKHGKATNATMAGRIPRKSLDSQGH